MTDYSKEYDLTKIPGPYLCKSGWWTNRKKDLPPDSIYQELKCLCKQIDEDEKRLSRLSNMKLPRNDWDPENLSRVVQTEELLEEWSMHLEALNRIRERLVKMEFGNRGGPDKSSFLREDTINDLPWSPGMPVEHSRYGALTEEHERTLKGIPYGAVNWNHLKVGDLVQVISGRRSVGQIKDWNFGVITAFGPVKSTKGGMNGPNDAVWAVWKKDKESALRETSQPWPQGGKGRYLADSMHGKSGGIWYRILDRNVSVSYGALTPEHVDVRPDQVRFKALTPEHESALRGIPTEPVDYTQLRKGDLCEHVPKSPTWNYFIVALVHHPIGNKKPDIYALFNQDLEKLKKEWAGLKPEMRNDDDYILKHFTEDEHGAILSIELSDGSSDKYHVLERDVHLKEFNAVDVRDNQVRFGALTPEHESYLVKVGDHVELISVAPLFSGLKSGDKGIVNGVSEDKDGKITIHFQEDISKELYGLVIGRDASFKILPYIPEGLVDYTQLMVGDFVSVRYDSMAKSRMYYGVVTHIGRPEIKPRTTSSILARIRATTEESNSYNNWVYAIWHTDRNDALRMFNDYSPGHFKIRKSKEEATLISGPKDHVLANTETDKNYTILKRGLHRKDIKMGAPTASSPSNANIPTKSAIDWLR